MSLYKIQIMWEVLKAIIVYVYIIENILLLKALGPLRFNFFISPALYCHI